jgi:hypothetical protein
MELVMQLNAVRGLCTCAASVRRGSKSPHKNGLGRTSVLPRRDTLQRLIRLPYKRIIRTSDDK